MKSFILFVLLVLIVISCKRDIAGSQHENGIDLFNSEISIPFETYMHYRALSAETGKSQLIVLKDKEEENIFIDTTSVITWFPRFDSYDTSYLIGVIHNMSVYANSSLTIDSIIMDTLTNKIRINSSIYKTNDERFPLSLPCHFVSIPEVNGDFRLEEIMIINESEQIKIIPFRTFIKGSHIFKSNLSYPNLIILRNEEDQRVFLDSTSTYSSLTFPNFNYADSLLVGIIMNQISTATPFEINGLFLSADSISVIGQMYFRGGTIPDPGNPCHFVAIRKEEATIYLKEIQSIIMIE